MRYGTAIARRLRASNHTVLLTTRKHPDTLPLADLLKENFVAIGRYDTGSLLSRLRSGVARQSKFCEMFKKDPPVLAISHGSPDLCRVAFGLGIPVITTVDTPYAEAVHKLTLPLSSYIVASRAIPKRILQRYDVNAKIVGFDGVDEVAWIKEPQPRVEYRYEKPLIVVRDIEHRATYCPPKTDLVELARHLTRLGNVIFLSRYHRKRLRDLIAPRFVDTVSLVSQADLFVGVGGTITREAALQGTPAIVINLFKGQYVNDFLRKKGFPIFNAGIQDALAVAKEVIGRKYDVKHLVDDLQNPVDIIPDLTRSLRL